MNDNAITSMFTVQIINNAGTNFAEYINLNGAFFTAQDAYNAGRKVGTTIKVFDDLGQVTI